MEKLLTRQYTCSRDNRFHERTQEDTVDTFSAVV